VSAAIVLLTAVLLVALLHHVPADPATGDGVDSSGGSAADALGGFTDDFDQLGQGKSEQLIVVEVDALLAFAVADGFGGGLA